MRFPAIAKILALTALLAVAGCGDVADEPAAIDEEPGTMNTAGANVPSSGSGGGAGSGGSSAGQAGGGGKGGSPGAAGGGGVGGTGGGGRAGAGGSATGGPAPPSAWANATGNLAGMASDCFNLGRVAVKPGTQRVVAGVALHGLFASDDAGKSWQALGAGASSAKITNRVSSITFDRDHPDVFWETGSHTGPGFYKTTDGGLSFQQLGTMTMSQDAAVDFADPERKTLLTGTHGRGIFRSTDGGKTFADISAGVPGNTLWPLLIDAQTYLIGTFDNDAALSAVYRTSDGGTTWNKVTTLPPSHDGTFLRASDGALYLPISGNAGIMKSTDLGKTWSKLAGTGATFARPFFSITPLELPDGTLVTVGADHLLRSSDGGASWKPIGEQLPFPVSGDFGGVTYAAQTKTFFLWHADCTATVPSNAIMSAGFDYAKP